MTLRLSTAVSAFAPAGLALERDPIRLNRIGALTYWFAAISRRSAWSASLEIALATLLTASVFITTPAAAQSISFQSPSGNIHCSGSGDPNTGGVRCDILQVKKISYPRRPADCDLDWGKAFYLDTFSPGTPTCHGDTIVNPSAPVLPYGQSRSIGEYLVCHSKRTGMECQNRRGHGIFLSRAKQQVY